MDTRDSTKALQWFCGGHTDVGGVIAFDVHPVIGGLKYPVPEKAVFEHKDGVLGLRLTYGSKTAWFRFSSRAPAQSLLGNEYVPLHECYPEGDLAELMSS